MKGSSERQTAGFTLLELQLALLLLILIGTLLFDVLQLGAKYWSAVTANSSRSEQLYQVQRFVRQQLRHSQPRTVRNDQGEKQVAFYGDEQRLTFLAPAPGAMQDDTLYWWTLLSSDQPVQSSDTDTENSAHTLQLGFEVFQHQGARSGRLASLITADDWLALSTNINRELLTAPLKFSYFSATDGWQNHWQEEAQLPLLIRIEIDKDTEQNSELSSTAWPLFEVTPLATEFNFSAQEDLAWR